MPRPRDQRRHRTRSDDHDEDWSHRISVALTGRDHQPEPVAPRRKPRRYGRRLTVFALVLLAFGSAAFAVGSRLGLLDEAEADASQPLIAQAEEPAKPPVPKPAAKPAPAKPTAAAEPQAGTQKFGDWLMLCQDAAQMTRKTCFVAQQIAEEMSKQVVFAWRFQYADDGNLAAIIRTPTGVFVNRGIILKLDENQDGLKVDFQLCDDKKCQAVANVSGDVLKALSATKLVSASLVLASGKMASVKIGMAGFPAAMAALAKLK